MVKLILRKSKEGKELPKDKWHFDEIEEKEEGSFYIETKLKANLDKVKKVIRDDWDFLYIIDGEVGSGKSVFAQQICYFVSDGDFILDEITFTPKEFKKQVLKSSKYNGVIWDESFRGLASRAAMSQTNKTLISLLQEIRQRNLFIFIVIPSVWDLDSYVKLHRCKGLFHIFTSKDRQRGYWKFYANKEDASGNSRFKRYFHDSKNKYSYPRWFDLNGRFPKFYPLGKDGYSEKKDKALGDTGYEDEVKKENRDAFLNRKMIDSLKEKGWSDREIGELCGIGRQAISARKNRQIPTHV